MCIDEIDNLRNVENVHIFSWVVSDVDKLVFSALTFDMLQLHIYEEGISYIQDAFVASNKPSLSTSRIKKGTEHEPIATGEAL